MSFDASGFGDRSLPLLSEVFERFPDTPVNIDIKVNRDELVAAVASLVAQYRRQAITVWGNFSATVTNKCHKQVPQTECHRTTAVRRACCVAQTARLLAWSAGGTGVCDAGAPVFQDPSIGLLCSMPAVVKIVLSAYVGLLPFLPLRETFFEVPMPSILNR